ncbi:MAG: hypothetical protein AAF499_03585 [Pseudomonadota bacterium]
MSDELRFSGQLISELLDVLKRHDERATEDAVSAQYFAGMIGFLLGRVDGLNAAQKKEVLDEMRAFAGHVMQDVEHHRAQQQPDPEPALGVWKPGDN